MVAINNDFLVAMRLQLGDPLLNFAHGQKLRLWNMNEFVFVAFSAIEEKEILVGVQFCADLRALNFERMSVGCIHEFAF